jgi:hypothetical protein
MMAIVDAVEFRDQAAPLSADSRPGDSDDRDPLELLAGAADWPSVDAALASRSMSMMSVLGIPAWCSRGGSMRLDGTLSFGSLSGAALRVVRGLCEQCRGFRSTDDLGATWLVIPSRTHSVKSGVTAIGLSWYGSGWPLDPDARGRAIRDLKDRMATLKRPGRKWSEEQRATYACQARALRRLRSTDLAAHILARLRDLQEVFRLDVGDVNSWALPTDGETPRDAAEIWDALRAAMQLHIAELLLGDMGWEPRLTCQSPAVTSATQTSPDRFRVEISPLWYRAVDELSALSLQEARTRAYRGPTGLRRASASFRKGQTDGETVTTQTES